MTHSFPSRGSSYLDAMVEKMAYANRDTGNVLGAAETAGMTEYLDHPAINPKQSKHWALDTAVAFPTLHINLSPGGFWSHRFWPISVNRTRWEAEFQVPKPERKSTSLNSSTSIASANQ